MIDTTHFAIWVIDHWMHIKAMLQAFFCGGIAFVIAFKYQRNGATYHFLPSLCAFGLASLLAQQWLSVVSGVLIRNDWPDVSIYDTLIFALLFILVMRSKGNVARMFHTGETKRPAR